jgi:hypothetical protein
MSGWVTGVLVATGVLIIIGYVMADVYESLEGSFFAEALAFAAGTGASAVVDGKRVRRYAEIIALYLILLSAGYILIFPVVRSFLTITATSPPRN